MGNEVFKLLLGAMGLLAFVAVLWGAARQTGTASPWARGGVVALAISGLFGLLLSLGRV